MMMILFYSESLFFLELVLHLLILLLVFSSFCRPGALWVLVVPLITILCSTECRMMHLYYYYNCLLIILISYNSLCILCFLSIIEALKDFVDFAF